MKVTIDSGMITLKNDRLGIQFYCPIITLKEGAMKLSFSTVLAISRNTWQFDWSAGFQLLGFGFGIAKYKEKNT